MIGVVALVGDCDVCDEAVDQLVRKGDVVALPWRSNQGTGLPERIACGVDFCAQATAGPANALGIGPVFCRRAPTPAKNVLRHHELGRSPPIDALNNRNDLGRALLSE
jgi:hypothetical protein